MKLGVASPGLSRRTLAATGLLGAAGLCLPRRARAEAVPAARMSDVPLRARDGRSVRWRSDVLRDHIAVVNFVYTTCASLCPPMSATLASFQQRLLQARDDRVVLVSLSVDPLTDTPQRLDAFARAFDPGPRWWWLTGEPRTVFGLLEALDAQTGGDPQTHAPVWLVGGVGHGPWRRLVGLPTPAQLHETVRSLG